MAKKTVDPATEVENFMKLLKHPLKKETQALREMIRSVDPEISERIKWKAPSYHLNGVDFLTFNLRDLTRIHLIFHHPSIEKIKSPLLEGDYKGRRMTYFADASAVKKGADELANVIIKVLKRIRD